MSQTQMHWRNVSKVDPCKVCQRPDWCSVSDDGAWATCRRVSDGGKPGVDRAGLEYWVHQLEEAATRERWDPPARPVPPRPELLDVIYRATLEGLTLTGDHREALRARGLDDAAIEMGAYRSLGVTGRAAMAKRLVERFERDDVVATPGVQVREEDGRRWLSFGGSPGLVVPVRDVDANIVALKVRSDRVQEGDERYRYVSSAARGGSSPGAPVHVPVWDAGHADAVRVTEGELKADVAAHLSGVRTISVAGTGGWPAVMPVLERLRPSEVLLAFDRDWPPNPHVCSAIERFAAELQGSYGGGVEVWRHAEGKGIDDVLLAGGETRVLDFHRRREAPAQMAGRELSRG